MSMSDIQFTDTYARKFVIRHATKRSEFPQITGRVGGCVGAPASSSTAVATCYIEWRNTAQHMWWPPTHSITFS